MVEIFLMQSKNGQMSNHLLEKLVSNTIMRFRHDPSLLSETSILSGIEVWIGKEFDRCYDAAWASVFEQHSNFFSMPPDHFLNRLVTVKNATVLCAIRFYGGDLTRPFVDVFAWTDKPSWSTLRDVMHAEWQAFHPSAIRVLTMDPPDATEVRRDQTVHVGMPLQMTAQERSPRLRLIDCKEASEAFASAKDWYAELREENEALADEVPQSEIEDLRDCQQTGALCWVTVDGQRMGIVGIASGRIAWLSGMVVNEEILARRVRGQGLGRFIQREVAVRLVEKGQNSMPIIGTIQHLNEASRRTAIRARRPTMMQYSFLPL
jgi:hypothetical protein